MLSPARILDHQDTGRLWPDGGAGLGDLAAAHQTALAVRALRVARGERPCGYKIGFTNRSIWSRYNVRAPIWGAMWDTTVTQCEGAGSVSLERICQPRIEPEAVFGFRTTPHDASLDAIFEALDWIAPGFEIVQSHAPDWKFEMPDTVADGGLHGHLLIGARAPILSLASEAGALERALAGARVVLHRNGEAVEEGAGANVLDGPLHALAHFIAELRACPGSVDLQPGDIVTTGTWTDAWPVKAGERWSTIYDAVLPGLAVRFV